MLYLIIFAIALEIILAVIIVRFLIGKTKKLRDDKFKLQENGKAMIENLKSVRFSLSNINPKLKKRAYAHKMSLVEFSEFTLALIKNTNQLLKVTGFFSRSFVVSSLVMKIIKERTNLMKTLK